MNNEQAGEGKVTVAADATEVDTSELTDIPGGYELVTTGTVAINDGWIFVEVRPIEDKTVTVGLNYWDIVNNVQAGEGSVEVAADATSVNTSTFTDVPAGYELVWTGDLPIVDGWVWVEVRPIEDADELYIINVHFEDVNGASFGGGDVISTHPDQVLNIADPTAPEGERFVGWKINGNIYNGDFSFAALSAFVDGQWTADGDNCYRASLTFVATFEKEPEEPVNPDEDYHLFTFEKSLVDDWYDTPDWASYRHDISYPYRGTVDVDEGDDVTLLYTLTVTGDEGAAYTIIDRDAKIYDEDGSVYGDTVSGTLGRSGEETYYAVKTFDWREIRDEDELSNTAYIIAGEDTTSPEDVTAEETVDVDVDWDNDRPTRPSRPSRDDEDEEDEEPEEVAEPEREHEPAYLNTEDHYAYITGYSDGTVRPLNDITRAEVATIFFRLLTDEARETYWSTISGYSDVSAGDWYNNAVSTLSNMGVIGGYPDGTFGPNDTISRAEFVAIATRFFDYTARYEGAFSDVSSAAWYADYIQAGVELGLVAGYPDGTFDPDGAISRAEACAIVNRVLGRVPHADYLLGWSVMVVWEDNQNTNAWYYADIQEATNSHDFQWIEEDGETVESWTEKLEERDWSALEEF